jgi:hypothetical protein
MLDYERFLRGCNAPDEEFKDFQNHHCYVAKECHTIDTSRIDPVSLSYFSDIEDCKEDSYFDCPALRKFNESMRKASEDNFSFYVGAATHYFTDAFVPLHQTMGESWWDCHLPFEEEIDEKLKKGERFWRVSQECYVYFPREKRGKANRKCEEGYSTNIVFTYEDIVNLIEKTDKTLTRRLNISHEGDYSYLFKRPHSGFFHLILSKIIDFLKLFLAF